MTLDQAIDIVRAGGPDRVIWGRAMAVIERQDPALYRRLEQAMLSLLKERGVRVNAEGWISYEDLMALFGDPHAGRH